MNTQTIADLLGWYASPRTSIISRYPLIDPSGGNGVYVYAELSPGRYVALANTHLPSDPYGPYLVRDGGTLSRCSSSSGRRGCRSSPTSCASCRRWPPPASRCS